MVKSTGLNVKELWEQHVALYPDAPSERTFRSWVWAGQKYAAIASAGMLLAMLDLSLLSYNLKGSVYTLMVIAARQSSYSCAALAWKNVMAVCRALRRPRGEFGPMCGYDSWSDTAIPRTRLRTRGCFEENYSFSGASCS